MMDRIISLVEQVRGEFGGRTIFQTAENSGAAVWLRELGSLKGFYLFENNRRYIIINKSLDKLLQQTVCAHEFGHDMLHRELSARKLAVSGDQQNGARGEPLCGGDTPYR